MLPLIKVKYYQGEKNGNKIILSKRIYYLKIKYSLNVYIFYLKLTFFRRYLPYFIAV